MKLHETSAFKMAIRFAGLFSLISTIALSAVYLVTVQELKAQIDRELISEIDELGTHYMLQGKQSLIAHIQNRQAYGQNLHHYYALTDLTFNHLAGNHFITQILKENRVTPSELELIDAFDIHHGENADNDQLRIASYQLDSNLLVSTAQSNNSIQELQEHTLSAVFVALFVSILSSLGIGVYMSRQALSHISNINQGLENSINHNFTTHLPIPHKEDEFHELTLNLNLMLSRIENLLTGMRSVTDNIAHDLRSPLTRLRNRLEVTLLQSRSPEEYQHVMEKAVEDCTDLLSTFNSLLSIAQAEAGVRGNDWKKIDVTTLVDDLAEMYAIVAEEKHIEFLWHKSIPVYVEGNRQLLAQAVSNLLENALKYTPEKGIIHLSVIEENSSPIIYVSDSGPGIQDKDKGIVIERFQRLDNARNSPGNGLGLSLVNAVANLHGATLKLCDNNPGLSAKIHFSAISEKSS